MMRIFAFIILAVWYQALWAVPATEKPVRITQPDGTGIEVYLMGDEFCHWHETLDGYTIKRDEDGWWKYAEKASDGSLRASGQKMNDEQQRSPNERQHLNDKSKHLRPGDEWFEHSPVMQTRQNLFKSLLKKIELRGLNKKAVPQTQRVLMLLIEFPDLPGRYSAENFDSLMNQPGYNGTGSFKDYYQEVSYGDLDVSVDVRGWYRAQNGYRYYGENSEDSNFPHAPHAGDLVVEAVDAAEAAGIDFSQYDNDGDGYLDAVIVVHSGPDEADGAGDDYIWSHMWGLSTAVGYTRSYDGVVIDAYNMDPETKVDSSMMTIGVFCHEFGHALGLPDLYDYGYDSWGVGSWCLMSRGNRLGSTDGETPCHISPVLKFLLQWGSYHLVMSDQNGVAIPPYASDGDYYILASNGDYSGLQTYTGELFIAENRQKTGFDSGLPGHGLLVWHIDMDRFVYNFSRPNEDQNHKSVDVEEADGKNDLDFRPGGNHGDGGDPFPGTSLNTKFDWSSNPNSRFYTQVISQIAVSGITERNDTIIANLLVNDHSAVYPDLSAGNNCAGWSDAILLSRVPGVLPISESFDSAGTFYIHSAIQNTGDDTLTIPGNIPVWQLYLDDQLIRDIRNYDFTQELAVQYHDNQPRGVSQCWDGEAVGVIFDLSMFENATLEKVDFNHFNAYCPGTSLYNLHVLDWENMRWIGHIDSLTAEETSALAVWETGIELGSLAGADQVGIFVEPLTPDSSFYDEDEIIVYYPSVSVDRSLDQGTRNYYCAINDPFSSYYSYFEGDLLINLWIRADGIDGLAKAPVISSSAAPKIDKIEKSMKHPRRSRKISVKNPLPQYRYLNIGAAIAFDSLLAPGECLADIDSTGIYLETGNYQLTMLIDPHGKLDSLASGNNLYSRQITVSKPVEGDLRPSAECYLTDPVILTGNDSSWVDIDSVGGLPAGAYYYATEITLEGDDPVLFYDNESIWKVYYDGFPILRLGWWNYSEPYKIQYHDNNPTSAFFQRWNEGFGTIFSLDNFGENVELLSLEFAHYGFGIFSGPSNFKVHIFDVINMQPIFSSNTLQAKDAYSQIEWDTVSFDSLVVNIPAIGVFIEPLSGSIIDDAYPAIMTDATPVAFPQTQYVINLNNPFESPQDVYYENQEMGDFIMNLWIKVNDEKFMAKRIPWPAKPSDASRIASGLNKLQSRNRRVPLSALPKPRLETVYLNLQPGAIPNENYLSPGCFSHNPHPLVLSEGQHVLRIQCDPDDVIVESDEENNVYERSFTILPVTVEELDQLVPRQSFMNQNFPNPFNPTTMIEFGLSTPGHVRIALYNLLGEQVSILFEGEKAAGNYKLQIDARSLPSGVYFYRIESVDFQTSRKLMLIK